MNNFRNSFGKNRNNNDHGKEQLHAFKSQNDIQKQGAEVLKLALKHVDNDNISSALIAVEGDEELIAGIYHAAKRNDFLIESNSCSAGSGNSGSSKKANRSERNSNSKKENSGLRNNRKLGQSNNEVPRSSREATKTESNKHHYGKQRAKYSKK